LYEEQTMSHELETLQLPDGMTIDAHARALRGELSRITGLKLNSTHTGTFHIGSSIADVQIETNALQIRLPLGEARSLAQKLQTSHELPTTVRYVLVERQLFVQGEAPLEPETLVESMLQIAMGLRMALGKRTRSNATEKLTPEQVDQVVRQLAVSPEDIVRGASQWEIHQRSSGEATPVTLYLDDGGVVASRKVLAVTTDHESFASLAHGALHVNGRLQRCRLAWHDGYIVAEARMPYGLLNANVLALHLCGVATAARHAQPVLDILLKVAAIEREFRRVFTEV
jgi:hypothetical protein